MTNESGHLEAAVNGRFSLPASAVRLWYSIGWQNIAYAGLASYFLLVVVTLVGTPFTYETWAVSDSLFLLNAGWAVAEGLTPHIDFADAYGGLDSYVLATLFRWVGPTVKALDYTVAIVYALDVLALILVSYRRLPFAAGAAVFLIVSAVCVTKYPLENGAPGLDTVAHSMMYNRFAWAAALPALAFTMVPSERGAVAGALGCAIAAFVLVLTKLTFLALAVPAVASLVLARRYTDLALVAGLLVAFAGAFWLLGGYGPAGYLNEIEYLLRISNYVSREKLTFGNKALYVLFYSSFDIAYLLILYAVLHLKVRQIGWAQATCLALLLLCSWYVMITTGSYGAPFVNGPVFAFCAALALVWALGAEAEGPERSAWRRLVIVLSIFSIAKFCAPYLLNEHVAFIKEATRAKQSLFASGPMKGYFVEENGGGNSGYAFGSFEEAERRIDARLQLEKSSEFIANDEALWPYLWKDGLDLLERVAGGRNLSGRFFLQGRLSFHGRDKGFGEISTVQQRGLPPFDRESHSSAGGR